MSTIKIQINGEEVKSLDQAIKLIQEAKEQEKKGLWRPEKDEKYFTIERNGEIYGCWINQDQKTTDSSFEQGNCFRTKAEAQSELDKRKALTRIKDYIAREGIEREKDWFDGDIIYDSLRMLGFSAEDTEKIIQACESDLKILFGIK